MSLTDMEKKRKKKNSVFLHISTKDRHPQKYMTNDKKEEKKNKNSN